MTQEGQQLLESGRIPLEDGCIHWHLYQDGHVAAAYYGPYWPWDEDVEKGRKIIRFPSRIKGNPVTEICYGYLANLGIGDNTSLDGVCWEIILPQTVKKLGVEMICVQVTWSIDYMMDASDGLWYDDWIPKPEKVRFFGAENDTVKAFAKYYGIPLCDGMPPDFSEEAYRTDDYIVW